MKTFSHRKCSSILLSTYIVFFILISFGISHAFFVDVWFDNRIDQYFAAVSQEYIYYTTVELPDSEELLEAAKNMLANLEDSSMHKNPETGEEYTDYVRLRNAVMAFGKNEDETRSYKSSLV